MYLDLRVGNIDHRLIAVGWRIVSETTIICYKILNNTWVLILNCNFYSKRYVSHVIITGMLWPRRDVSDGVTYTSRGPPSEYAYVGRYDCDKGQPPLETIDVTVTSKPTNDDGTN